jgi:hypothetical protein
MCDFEKNKEETMAYKIKTKTAGGKPAVSWVQKIKLIYCLYYTMHVNIVFARSPLRGGCYVSPA